jgi:broad specificity phosphatase PhoE
VLVIVRHGQSELNAAGRLAGRADTPLTALGRAQAARLATAVAALGQPDRVVSSPLRRALDTAAAISDDVVVDDRWVELDYGPFDGAALRDVPSELWASWRSDVTWVPPGAESLVALGERVRQACNDLVAAEENLTVVVTHVSPIKAAVAWALGVGDEVAWRMFVAPASVTVIGTDDRGPVLRAFNVTAHLDGVTA